MVIQQICRWSLLLFLIITMGCGSESQEEIDLKDDQLLQEYFAQNGLNPQKTSSGLYFTIDEPGSNERPSSISNVVVHYRGYFLNGQEFDSSIARGVPAEFNLQGVIPGWTEGIQLFGRGGKGSLFIISRLAYGQEGRGSIPSNTPLAFDVEVLDFN